MFLFANHVLFICSCCTCFKCRALTTKCATKQTKELFTTSRNIRSNGDYKFIDITIIIIIIIKNSKRWQAVV